MNDTDGGEVMTVLPKELRLNAPATMPQARSYLFRQQSTLPSYSYDEQIQINIPRLQRSYLSKDSYLQFRLNGQFTPGTPVDDGDKKQYIPDLFLDDAGAWSLFERLEVFDYLGSTILETVDSLPQLASLLIDMGADFTDPDHEGSVIHGLGESFIATNTNDNSINQHILPISGPFSGTTTNLQNGPSPTNKWKMDNAQMIIKIGTAAARTVQWTSGTTEYSDYESWLDAFNVWIQSLNLVDANGNPFEMIAKANYTYKNSIGTPGTQLVGPSAFTVSQVTGTTGTNVLPNYLGMYSTTISTYSSTSAGAEIVGVTGVGKSFYCGGMNLASYGTTRDISQKNFSFRFGIPLPSFLGFLSKKMVPLHNGFTIVLTIASKFKPMFMAAKQVPVLIAVPDDTVAPNPVNITQEVGMNAINTLEPTDSSGNVNSPSSLPNPSVFWWNITDVAMICQILELGPVAESMILSSTQGDPMIVHTKQLRHYRGLVGATSPEFSLPLNLNVSSLTNLLWFMQPNGTENDLRYASVGSRCRNALWRWEFQYGSTVLPQSQGIQCMDTSSAVAPPGINFTVGGDYSQWNSYSECYNELIKARPTIPNRGRLTRSNYSTPWYPGIGARSSYGVTPWRCVNSHGSLDGPYGGSGEQSKFACGLNTELSPGKTDLICGLNTNGMNTLIRGYFHPVQISNGTLKFESSILAYAEYDAFINISPGIATTVSF